MTWASLIFFRRLALVAFWPLALLAATVAGHVELKDSRDPAVRKKLDYSGVVVSLIFVGLQIRQNTGALQRNEHNSTMTQWSCVRFFAVRQCSA